MAGIGVIAQLVGYVAGKSLPAASPDTTTVAQNVRLGNYGDVAVNTYLTKKQALAGEGTYFVTANPTPGTGVGAGPLAASFANTAAWFIFQNNNPAGGPTAYLDYLKMIITAAAGGGTITNENFVVYRDTLQPLSTFVTTATSMVTATPNNINGLSPIGSKCTFSYQGGSTAIVNKAPSAASAIVGRASLGASGTTGEGIVGEEWVLDFGATDPAPIQGLTATGAATCGRKVGVLPPVVCPPQTQIVIVPWYPTATTSGFNYEFEFTHIER
jgi:hypothetical protein